MKIFQYAAILHPTEKEKKDGKRAELILELTTVLASNEAEAQLIAARAIPAEHADKLDRVMVALRPF
jgi:hypothetical protein